MLPVVQADTMHHSEKGDWVLDCRAQNLLVSKMRTHRYSQMSFGSSVDENSAQLRILNWKKRRGNKVFLKL